MYTYKLYCSKLPPVKCDTSIVSPPEMKGENSKYMHSCRSTWVESTCTKFKFSIMVSGSYVLLYQFYFYSCTGFIWNGGKRVPIGKITQFTDWFVKIISFEGWWIFFVRDTCGAGTGCMFQK